MPNFNLCMERLAPLGIRVGQVKEDNALPFKDGCFDIVVNRHEAYDIPEVLRVLKPGGFFITQQVGGKNGNALSRLLIPGFVPPFYGFCLQGEAEKFKSAGFDILFSGECFPRLRFFDTGAVVYYAKAIKWEFPGFSVERCFGALSAVDELIKKNGFFESLQHRFIISAQKSI